MTFSVIIPNSLMNFLDSVKASGRRNLFSAAANALKIEVQEHLRREAPRRHFSAESIGGRRTNHLSKGASRVSFSADDNHGEVHIPIAGISRAFHDVVITPRHAKALTIPVHGAAYGHRASELSRMGWMIFQKKTDDGDGVLMGYQKDMTKKKGQKTAVPLYALKKRVQQRQDRSLLPSDQTINSVVARAMMAEIQRVSRKTG